MAFDRSRLATAASASPMMMLVSQTMVVPAMVSGLLFMAKPFWRPLTNLWLKRSLDMFLSRWIIALHRTLD